MNKCDEMFYEYYLNPADRSETALNVWRDCWKACTDRMIYQMQSRTKLFTEGMRNEYETNQYTQPAPNVRKRLSTTNVQQGQGKPVSNRTSSATTIGTATQEALERIRRGCF